MENWQRFVATEPELVYFLAQVLCEQCKQLPFVNVKPRSKYSKIFPRLTELFPSPGFIESQLNTCVTPCSLREPVENHPMTRRWIAIDYMNGIVHQIAQDRHYFSMDEKERELWRKASEAWNSFRNLFDDSYGRCYEPGGLTKALLEVAQTKDNTFWIVFWDMASTNSRMNVIDALAKKVIPLLLPKIHQFNRAQTALENLLHREYINGGHEAVQNVLDLYCIRLAIERTGVLVKKEYQEYLEIPYAIAPTLP